jgi:hypothetical protein
VGAPRVIGSFGEFRQSLFPSSIQGGSFALALSIGMTASTYCLWIFLQQYRIYYVGWIACGLLALALRVRGKVRGPQFAVASGLLPLFWVYVAISATWSPDPAYVMPYAGLSLAYLGVFWIGGVWSSNSSPWWLSAFYLWVVLAHLLIAAVSLWRTGFMVDPHYGTIRSAFGFAFVSALPLLMWRAAVAPSLQRHALVYVVIAAAISAGNRAALLLLPLIGIATVVVLARYYQTRRGLSLIGLVLVAVVPLAIVAFPGVTRGLEETMARFGSNSFSLDISERVEEELRAVETAADIDRRLQAFVAITSFAQRPITGRGYYSTYIVASREYGREAGAHGLPFFLLGETGIVGTVLFAGLIIGYYTAVWRKAQSSATDEERAFWLCASLAMAGMLGVGMFQQPWHDPNFYALLGIGLAGPNLSFQTKSVTRRRSEHKRPR